VLEVGYPQTAALTPLAYNTQSSDGNASTPLQSSRYDLALTTISGFKNNVLFNAPQWAVNTNYAVGAYVTDNGSIYVATAASSPSSAADEPGTAGGSRWTVQLWYSLMMTPSAGGVQRFQANPFVEKPVTPASVSKQAPIFLPACTQFIIEFAGDYISQIAANPDEWVNTKSYAVGDVVKVPAGSTYTIYVAVAASTGQQPPNTTYWQTAVAGTINTYKPNGGISPDGQMDFVQGTNQIRWYGLPRDTNGNGVITANDGDVVPVCDVSRTAMPFEKSWPFNIADPTHPPVASDIPAAGSDFYINTNMPKNAAGQIDPSYTVAWGPADTNRPKLVRITLVVDRPEAASNQFDGSTFEYVFKLGL
jgi:chitodextrinase